ncbi:hypothetical protein ACFPVT_04730 [Corynebacterium choanae]|uniref:Uncharacterized protein n=1 Tax=Corynebacterium choanae TaxID=1862358 RepID=A0A3G6JBN2_9CORY|nr:hypothetical protein [Corynebacterium choanae]AZA14508.1 hypothetical protein CCHOA_10645 [Corynebacterium choanae]
MERSTGTNKNSLCDSYFRAIRWATDRIRDEGVIAFISDSSFVDDNTADGLRLTWQNEFSDIFIYNLRGGIRRGLSLNRPLVAVAECPIQNVATRVLRTRCKHVKC